MRRAADKQAAKEYTLGHLRREVADRKRIVGMHERDSAGDAYRREILRLWRKALKAVQGA